MIKNIFLNQKSKPATRTIEHTTYILAQRIGLLYNADEYTDTILEQLISTLEGDGKFVWKQGFTEKTSEDPLKFSKKDITNTGGFKKNGLESFTKQSFDFLISLDSSGNINYKYVLAMSKAICKIGFETESYSNLLQMSMKPSSDKEASVKNLVRYLKMI